VLQISSDLLIRKILFLTASIATLLVAPLVLFDPINLPKLLITSIGATAVAILLLSKVSLRNLKFSIKVLSITSIAGLFCALSLNNNEELSRELWGTFGRNNGTLFYLCLTILWIGAASLRTEGNLIVFEKTLIRVGYIQTIYVTLQLLELDPIKWSQEKALVGTLGNLNFMSSFLGAASIIMVLLALDEATAISSKAFYLLVSAWNLFIIYVSGSLQGIAMFVVGVATFYSAVILGSKRLHAGVKISFFFVLFTAGASSILGLFGEGPFGGFLQQQTMLFRRDYITAGLNMFIASPIFGHGLDAYGDLYRQFRDQIAVTRTGPQRVSNAAHSVFVDWGVGGGVLVLAPLTILLAYPLYKSLRRSLAISYESKLSELRSSALLFSWLFILVFGINQIGTSLWIWILAGLLMGVPESNSAKLARRNKSNSTEGNFGNSDFVDSKNVSKGYCVVLGILSCLVGFAAVLPPVKNDWEFMRANSKGDLETMWGVSTRSTSTTFYSEITLEKVAKVDPGGALELARELLSAHPNSFFGWATIARFSSGEEKKIALSKLRELDPLNLEIPRG